MKKKIIWIITIIGIFVFINGISSVNEFKKSIPLIKCEDYFYKMEFDENSLPVKIVFYTLDDGKEEIFKTVVAKIPKFDTILHCGHDYKVIYSFEGYEDFIDYISIPESNPLIKKTTKIEVQ